MTTGRLEAIWIKRARRGAMDAVSSVELTAGGGLVGSADQGGSRQVTVITSESWRAMMEELGATISPAARRANLMVGGIDLEGSRGHILIVGPAAISIRGETRPCERMDEAHQGLRAAMEARWRGGVYGIVLRGGQIAVGDDVTLLTD
jgi:MOSC domain-containing protein YiiM